MCQEWQIIKLPVISTVKCNHSIGFLPWLASFFQLKQIEGSVLASAYFVLPLSRYRVKGLSDVLPT